MYEMIISICETIMNMCSCAMHKYECLCMRMLISSSFYDQSLKYMSCTLSIGSIFLRAEIIYVVVIAKTECSSFTSYQSK